jgi:hypothetical protein
MSDDENLQDDSNANRPSSNNENSVGQNNSTTNNEKAKRHRRGKLDTANERIYKCPDCDKSYLSGPALVIHRKSKHGYVGDGEKKARGRPKASDEQEISYRKTQEYFNSFFDNGNRKKNINEKIDVEAIKSNFKTIFTELKNNIFKEINNVEDYPLYQLVTNLWDIKDIDLAKECFSESSIIKKDVNGKPEKNCPNPPMEQVFYLYLKDLSEHTNKKYFEFGLKFITLYREFINNFKKNVAIKYDKDNKFSQLFSAEGVPESFNDFFLDFLQPKEYFGHKDKEFIELAQYFCFWLYAKKYTQSYLTLVNE